MNSKQKIKREWRRVRDKRKQGNIWHEMLMLTTTGDRSCTYILTNQL